jgi:hypothetical protein
MKTGRLNQAGRFIVEPRPVPSVWLRVLQLSATVTADDAHDRVAQAPRAGVATRRSMIRRSSISTSRRSLRAVP